MAHSLAEEHDALLVDLDGTLALAGHVIEYAVDSIIGARKLGARVLVVTNNASRSPASVAERLAGLGVPMDPADVVSSPQAAASMLAERHHAGGAVLVVGADALRDAISAVGLTPVRSADDAPVAVVQGHSPDTGWRDLAEACVALRAGVDWVATNTDSTLPTDRGLLPGNGSMVQVLVTATGRSPRVAGKPARPLLDAAVQRAGAKRPLVVGDRLDTDIAAAVAAGLPSLLVLTGVSSAADLLAATPEQRPTFVSGDLRGLLDPDACAALPPAANGTAAATGATATGATGTGAAGPSVPTGGAGIDAASTHATRSAAPGDDAGKRNAGDAEDSVTGWQVISTEDSLELRAVDGTAGSAVAALAELARHAWATGVTRVHPSDSRARAALHTLGLA